MLALTSTATNKVICKNLQTDQKARGIYATENSEKLRHAVSRNIRTSGDIKYLTDDSIYFKHLETAKSIRVHPCQLQPQQ